MPATGPARGALSTLLAAALAAVLAAAVIPATAAGAGAASARLGSDPATVRLVVRTVPGAAAAVTAAAEAAGGARVGQVRRLRSVSFEVSAAGADRLRTRLARREDVTSVGVAHRRWFFDEPADPRFGEQRAYLGAIGLPAAWDLGAIGNASVRIAVVDSGVDVTHPDLAGKVVGTHNSVTGGSDVHDVVGHGTGTASVAAAATGNGVGIAGAGRNTSLLAVKVADVTARIFTDDLAAGIVWAVDHGADVVNLSLGGPTSDRLERAAVAYALAHDVPVVAAAGNEDTPAKQFPAALPGVIGVGATSANGAVRAPFSSFGSWVDLAAPGRSIVVATPGGGYEIADGTSYSAPLVSGIVALLAAYRPGRSAAQLGQALVGGADAARIGFAHGLAHADRSLQLLPPATVPTLAEPAPGSGVSGVVTVAASSSAPRVRLQLADLVRTVSTSGGVGAASFETFGLSGSQPVSATDCSAVDQCSAQDAAASVVVDNGVPAVSAPTAGQEVRGETVHISASVPGGAVLFTIGDEQAVDTTAPYQANLAVERLADGAHTVRVLACRSDGKVCDGRRPAEVPVRVTRLHPGIVSFAPHAISPDGDGRHDTATVTYRLGSRAGATLVVRDAATRAVLRRKALGTQGAGTHTATWNGRNGAGQVVPDGDVTLQIVTSDGTLQGSVSTFPLRVDRTRPRLRAATLSSRRVLPVHDDYLDRVQLTGRLNESVRKLAIEVRTPSGSLVRRQQSGNATASAAASAGWDGRTSSGAVAPSGRYVLRLVATDASGNVGRSASRTVTLSGQRLVQRSGSATAPARESLQQSYQDDCSQVFRRTGGAHRGWVGYGASSVCTSGDSYAAADHQFRLPAAVRYGSVRVSAYGGRGDRRYRDSAKVVYYDALQNLSARSFRLGPSVGTYTGPRAAAGRLLIRSRVLRWMTITTGVAWYDVKSYRVDYTYFVLR